MSWLRIAVFYVVAALVTLHLLSETRREAAVSEAETASDAPFLAAVPERIDRVRMEDASMALVFERRDGRWVTTEPEGLAPPGDVIDAVLDSFTGLPAIEVVSAGSQNEAQFGLAPPQMRVRLEQEGALVSTIVLGQLSPTRTAVYAKKSGSDDVALIGLNAKYYIDLVFENVRRQRRSAGIEDPAPALPVLPLPGEPIPGSAAPAVGAQRDAAPPPPPAE